MHDAPSVSYPAGRSLFAARLLLGTWLLGCAVAMLWYRESTQALRPGLMVAVLCATGLFAAWQWWRTPEGTLAWDGTGWNWSAHPADAGAGVDVALDLQQALLLRWTGGGAARWIWLERAALPERWDDIRRAVYSRARRNALQPAERPAAKP
jgi:toxin CptA